MKRILLISIVLAAAVVVGAQNLKPKKDKATKKYGYVNPADEWVVEPTYDDADKVKNGYGVIYKDKKRGLIDETGKVIVEPRFDDIDKFKEGYAQVELNDKKGLILPDGKVLFEPQFDKIDKFSDGVAEVKTGDKYGLISNSGKVLFEPQFDRLTSFDKEGVADVETADKWGLINRDGKMLFEPQFSERLRFLANGLAIAQKGTSKGLVKKDGTIAYKIEAQTISFEQGVFVIGTGNVWRLYSENLKPISGAYDEMAGLYGMGATKSFIRDNRIAVRKGDKWGFISADGDEAIKVKFDRISFDGFRAGFCAVKVGEKWGYIRNDGSWFKEPEFESADSFVGLGTVAAANVVKDGKKFRLKNDGTLEDLTPTPAPAPAPVQTETVAAAAPQTLNAAPAKATAAPAPAASAAPAVDPNLWLHGTWVVEEEYMGSGKVRSGRTRSYDRYEFSSNGRATVVERDMISGNDSKKKTDGWKLNGNSLKIGSLSYTISDVSPDKRTMKIKGILGTWWKVRKK